jgi:DNA-binding NtrC family response regulator
MNRIRSHASHRPSATRRRHNAVCESALIAQKGRQPCAANDVLIGESGAIRRLRATIERIAAAPISVLIEGPTGSGKELVAALLHRLSGRSGALVAFNVCAIGDTMFEDALFGHVRGAYTGAGTDTAGFFREAHGGTLFMDEIGGLPAPLQPKLLRALETGVFRPIGSSRDAKSDFRLVAATNEPINHLVDAGRFRPDLAHRMSGIVLTLPSLDERSEDVPRLVHHFARGRRVEANAMQALESRSWPGNVRELRQVVDAAFVFGRDTLDRHAVQLALEHRPAALPARTAEKPSDYLAIERTRLISALDQSAWNTVVVARAFGVHRSTLYRRLKRLKIALPPSMKPRPERPEPEMAFLISRPAAARDAGKFAASFPPGANPDPGIAPHVV